MPGSNPGTAPSTRPAAPPSRAVNKQLQTNAKEVQAVADKVELLTQQLALIGGGGRFPRETAILQWDATQAIEFVCRIEFGLTPADEAQVRECFQSEKVTGKLLVVLDSEGLKEAGVSSGLKRAKILARVKELATAK